LPAQALVPGRGDALVGHGTVREAIAMTRDFVQTLYAPPSCPSPAAARFPRASPRRGR
jgi:hypothetical protein